MNYLFHFLAPVVPPPLSMMSSSNNSGYITVDQANKMLLKQNNVNTSRDPRAYSKVAIAPNSSAASKPTLNTSDQRTLSNSTNSSEPRIKQTNNSVVPTASAASTTSGAASLVMSAKDLQVESRPPFMKVVTTLDDGSSATKSTMV